MELNASPGNVDELVENATLLVMDIDRKIRRIANFVPAAPNPVAIPVLPPMGAVDQDPVILQPVEADGDADSNPADEAELVPAVDFDGDLPRPVPAMIPIVQPQYKCRYKKVEPRKFHGDPAEFPRWMSSFMSNINSDRKMPAQMKLDQLLAAVEGPPKGAVQGLTYTAASFQIAIDILTERFGQVHLIVESLQNQLLSLQLVSTRAVDLRIFFDKLNVIIRQLADVDGASAQNGMTCQLIIGKLPSRVFDECC